MGRGEERVEEENAAIIPKPEDEGNKIPCPQQGSQEEAPPSSPLGALVRTGAEQRARQSSSPVIHYKETRELAIEKIRGSSPVRNFQGEMLRASIIRGNPIRAGPKWQVNSSSPVVAVEELIDFSRVDEACALLLLAGILPAYVQEDRPSFNSAKKLKVFW